MTDQYTTRYFADVNVADVVHVYALRLNFLKDEDSATLVKEFKKFRCDMSVKRYGAIMSSLCCDWKVFASLLRELTLSKISFCEKPVSTVTC